MWTHCCVGCRSSAAFPGGVSFVPHHRGITSFACCVEQQAVSGGVSQLNALPHHLTQTVALLQPWAVNLQLLLDMTRRS